ncbi:hypothetical protein P3S68_004555 [Capsicum galapagoense]
MFSFSRSSVFSATFSSKLPVFEFSRLMIISYIQIKTVQALMTQPLFFFQFRVCFPLGLRYLEVFALVLYVKCFCAT